MISGLRENDRQISDDKEMADVFNNYFVNIAAQLKEPAEKSDFKHISEFVNSKVNIHKAPTAQKYFKHQEIKQKEPPQKYRLGTISNTKLLAGLNRFYTAVTSPSHVI